MSRNADVRIAKGRSGTKTRGRAKTVPAKSGRQGQHSRPRPSEEEFVAAALKSHEAEKEAAHASRSASLLVRRPHLMEQLRRLGEQDGVVFVCAPSGFGKTAVLLERVMVARKDPRYHVARIIDAWGMRADELMAQLAAVRIEADLESGAQEGGCALLALDNLPRLSPQGVKELIEVLRAMRQEGWELVVSCTPAEAAVMDAMGDSGKLRAQALTVRAREYRAWAQELSIASSLDMYGLTQGVPALVVALQGVTDQAGETSVLDRVAVEVYRPVLLGRGEGRLRRLMRAMFLACEGEFTEIDGGWLHVRQSDLSVIARDYPLFGLDESRRSFCCLRMGKRAREQIARDVISQEPALALHVARALMRAGRTDDAMWLAGDLMDRSLAAQLIAQFPTQPCLDGHAVAVRAIFDDVATARGRAEADSSATSPGLLLAAHVASLMVGDRRTVRATAAELARHAREVERCVDPCDWSIAKAAGEVWGASGASALPRIDLGAVEEPARAQALRLHVRAFDALADGELDKFEAPLLEAAREGKNALDVTALLARLDLMLLAAFAPESAASDIAGAYLDEAIGALEERKMLSLSVLARFVRALCDLLRGEKAPDDVFSEASTLGVRTANLSLQLLSLLARGWSELLQGQAVSAQFRAQQALRLSQDCAPHLRGWADLLERTATLATTSVATLREEADNLDLEESDPSPLAAWTVALTLSAVRYDAELSAWYSRHRDVLLDDGVAAMARLALACAGAAGASLLRLLPEGFALERTLAAGRVQRPLEADEESLDRVALLSLGQVKISLFGGLRVEKNGHMVADGKWRRKKASALAARLALCPGAFVTRRAIIHDLWPNMEFQRGRENLYVTMSALRKAFGQISGGPEYVLVQGDGVSLNTEYVLTDIARFDALARDVLLHRDERDAGRIVETCLLIEELYPAPLFVPDRVAPEFFLRMRESYATKFLDCMLIGTNVAIQEGQMPSAAWLARAAFNQAPEREDVARIGMRVFGLQGRRREAAELYNAHLHALMAARGVDPGAETREVYERVARGIPLAAPQPDVLSSGTMR